MKHHSKLGQKQEHIGEHKAQTEGMREFEGPEEALRFDAEQTVVPQEIERRLAESVKQIRATERRVWWRALFERK